MKRGHMKAILSGQAGLVVLVQGQSCTYRQIGDSEYRQCRRQDIPYFFADATDVISVSGKSTEQAYRLLEHEWTLDRALHLTLILLDHNAHLRAKRICAHRLEALLATAESKAFIVHRLYAAPLPGSADIAEAIRLSVENSSKTVFAMLTALRDSQERISVVRERWERLDDQLFGGFPEKRVFEQVAIEEGIFCALARGIAEPIEQWLSNPRVRKFSYCERVIHAWSDPLVIPRKEPRLPEQIELFQKCSRQE